MDTYFLTDMLNLAVEKINIKLILNSVRKIWLFFIDYKNMQKKTVDLSKTVPFWTSKSFGKRWDTQGKILKETIIPWSQFFPTNPTVQLQV